MNRSSITNLLDDRLQGDYQTKTLRSCTPPFWTSRQTFSTSRAVHQLAALTLAIAASLPTAQTQTQHELYAAADIAYGARLYTQHCATCHGPTGDGVGGVDLRSGKFRNASTDQDLARVITQG